MGAITPAVERVLHRFYAHSFHLRCLGAFPNHSGDGNISFIDGGGFADVVSFRSTKRVLYDRLKAAYYPHRLIWRVKSGEALPRKRLLIKENAL
jgi:hypothetical protein